MQMKDERLDEMTKQMDRLTQMLTASSSSGSSQRRPNMPTSTVNGGAESIGSSGGTTSPIGAIAASPVRDEMTTSLIDI